MFPWPRDATSVMYDLLWIQHLYVQLNVYAFRLQLLMRIAHARCRQADTKQDQGKIQTVRQTIWKYVLQILHGRVNVALIRDFSHVLCMCNVVHMTGRILCISKDVRRLERQNSPTNCVCLAVSDIAVLHIFANCLTLTVVMWCVGHSAAIM